MPEAATLEAPTITPKAVETPSAEGAPPVTPAVTPPAEGTTTPKPETKPEVKPEVKFDLKLPEGSKLAPTAVEEAAKFAKENGLSPEQAQKLLDRESTGFQSLIADHDKAVQSWKEAALADPDLRKLGGEDLTGLDPLIQPVMDKFGSPELSQFLVETGYRYHPSVVKFLVNLGNATREDRLVNGGQPASVGKTHAQVMYENHPTT